MLPIGVPWTRQAPRNTPLNWGHSILRDLRFFVDVRQGLELVEDNRATANTITMQPGYAGEVGNVTGTANQQYAHRAGYAITGAITLVAWAEIRSLSNYTAIIAKQASSTTHCPFEWRCGNAPTGGDFNLARSTASDYKAMRAPATILSAAPSQPQLLAVRSVNGLVETLLDGFVKGVKTQLSTVEGAAFGNCTDNGSAMWVARRIDGATQLDGGLYYVAGFARHLTDAELEEIRQAPYLFYEPIPLWDRIGLEVYIFRPGSDITTTGWTGYPDNTNKYANIDEATANDSDFIASPQVTGAQGPIIFGIKDHNGNAATVPVGTWSIGIRGNFTDGADVSEVRVLLLDSGGTSVGASSWQTLTAVYADYTLSITTTGIAARIRIEVR